MSKLFYSDNGRALLHNHEEITAWRWAKKTLKLPAAAAKASADLLLCISEYEGNKSPLVIELNGKHLASIDPAHYPPNHGSMIYAETDIVWYDPTHTADLDMFPNRVAKRAFFDAKA